MKQFYKQVRVDAEALCFCVRCDVCGKELHGMKIPLFCRSVRTLARCENGKANRMSQSIYNHAKANATQLLAMRFNQCRHCYRWVCDECYDTTDVIGACKKCSQLNIAETTNKG